MPASQLNVEHLFTMTATTQQIATVAGPQGTRVMVRVTGGTFEGPKLRGKVEDAGGDWVTVRPDGTFRLDVRVVLTTDDGAAILVSYNGIGRQEDGALRLRTAPTFETGDERYAWLNGVQAVGLGQSGQGSVTYEVYQLL
ncbi:MAG: DUF3237 domain-containing protein [Hyphomicrobiales bacterium]